MHASALEHLTPFVTVSTSNEVCFDAKVLDVGCGCGYFTVLCARANPSAKVLGLDYILQLVELSETNTAKEVWMCSEILCPHSA
jgi:2-polyprenyl-3-methyl-5-hydroxy-6-metoxy-1,4-benzoquinol methylase